MVQIGRYFAPVAALHGVMERNQMIEKLLLMHEGESLMPYLCTAGRLTVGVGRNIQDNGITLSESRLMLLNDIARCEKEAEQFFFWGRIGEVREAVVLDMLFNLGLTRFRQFKKMTAALDRAKYDLAADEMLDSRWAQQVGQRATRLAEMMRSGQWPEILTNGTL